MELFLVYIRICLLLVLVPRMLLSHFPSLHAPDFLCNSTWTKNIVNATIFFEYICNSLHDPCFLLH